MPAAKLAHLEKELSMLNLESLSINVKKGTVLHTEIKHMLSHRHFVSGVKSMVF